MKTTIEKETNIQYIREQKQRILDIKKQEEEFLRPLTERIENIYKKINGIWNELDFNLAIEIDIINDRALKFKMVYNEDNNLTLELNENIYCTLMIGSLDVNMLIWELGQFKEGSPYLAKLFFDQLFSGELDKQTDKVLISQIKEVSEGYNFVQDVAIQENEYKGLIEYFQVENKYF